MLCCLLEMRNPENANSLKWALALIRSHLEPEDRFARISQSQLLLVTPLNLQDAIRKKISALQEEIFRVCGPSFVLNCGYAEVVNFDIVDAIDAAGQVLRRPHQDNAIIGMCYLRLQDFSSNDSCLD